MAHGSTHRRSVQRREAGRYPVSGLGARLSDGVKRAYHLGGEIPHAGWGRGSFDEKCAKSAISAIRPSMGDGCKVANFKLELSFCRR